MAPVLPLLKEFGAQISVTERHTCEQSEAFNKFISWSSLVGFQCDFVNLDKYFIYQTCWNCRKQTFMTNGKYFTK